MSDEPFALDSAEAELYEASLACFSPNGDPSKTPYTVMMPPPNVTGSLHLGHALTYTLQDILVRFKRAMGYDTLWQPGTDHAGIATQLVVERQLSERGVKRQDLGREKFLEKVWEWKGRSGGTIVDQQKKLRISPDWSRSRFTMDEGLSEAVVEVFAKLYEDGLIYRDKRLVNWDPATLTAVSDLEVIVKEEPSDFWYLRYPLEDDETTAIIIATTRPETMFGDVAVAVSPNDERYRRFIGKRVRVPLTDRVVPVIADEYCDPEKGSGAVKITPAHDFNDFEVGNRHNLERVNILDKFARLNDAAPEKYRGTRFDDARKAIALELAEKGFVEKIEKVVRPVPYGERSGAEIQPYLTDQWYVDAKKLAKPAIEAVKYGRIKFVPRDYEKTYFEWLENIQPWCVSRQIWWGHRIPAWFGPKGEIFVATSEEKAYEKARAEFGENVALTPETDVLDTWFSSALWPFTTLGWPKNTPELKRHYPTDTLVTGFDIIFFWVARMIMMGLYFMKDVPFKTVYVHALVRDEKGQKMSKSKGNAIDPSFLIDKYGSDSLRFTLCAMAAPGRDVKLGEARVEGYRNFRTKIQNSARFLEINGCVFDPLFKPEATLNAIDRWMVGHIDQLKKTYVERLNDYRFDLTAHELYRSFRYQFCDRYLEAAKISFRGDSAESSKRAAMWVFFEYLKLLQPIMPSVSSFLAKRFGMSECLSGSTIELASAGVDCPETEVLWKLIDEVRSLKGLLNLSGGTPLKGYMVAKPSAAGDFEELFKDAFQAMARIKDLEFLSEASAPADSLPVVAEPHTVFVVYGDVLSSARALESLESKKATLTEEIERALKKTGNEAYKNAKPEAWAEDERALKLKKAERKKLEELLAVI